MQDDLAKVGQITSLKEEAIDYSLSFIKNAPKIWNNSGIEHKIIYQNLLFPSGLPYDLKTNKFGTAEINPLYRLMATQKDAKASSDDVLVISRRIELRLPG
ncbi:MAG: hypothetical protein JWM00_362 [Candidatus Saccharibacteria bacterium]|nr:hypothetical protein [Candidatus Saccharibacteria bacterium]